jgi:DNA-binding NarL/FixJ family response regulator
MPTTTVDTRIITDAVRLACRAPSLHNSQPWRLVVGEQSVQLFADPGRIVRAADTSGREALLSCGVLLDHFRVAMAAAGFRANVDRFPDPDNWLHIATLTFTPVEFVTDRQRQRANAILLRRTDRLPFAAPPAWDRFEAQLHDTVDGPSVRVDAIPDHLRPQLAEASQLTESFRLYDSSYHSELRWWTAALEFSEGIPHSSLVSAAESDRVDVGRTFPVTRNRERRPEVDEDRSRIVVLSTCDDSREAVLRCGERLSAVLLDATVVGFATCTLTHITEIASSRALVAGLIDQSDQDTTPQVLIRVGLAPSIEDVPPPTPRRPIGEVLNVAREDQRLHNRPLQRRSHRTVGVTSTVPATSTEGLRVVKVFLVDDHEVVRRGLMDLLGADADLEVVGEAGSVAQALARIPALQPDVAVLDVRLPDGNGIELCRELLSQLPDLRCLMLTSFTSDEAMLDAILAGASGYVVKDIKGMELAKAIKEVGAGRSLLDNRAAAALMAKLRGAAEQSDPLAELSHQERVLLDLLGEGLTNKQIAARMFLAEKTVKNYVSRLLAKLGMERRTQAAVFISKLDQSRAKTED